MVLEEKRSFASDGALTLSCLYLISKWTIRRIWPFRLCLLFFRKFYWCYFFFRACCLYVENPLGGSIALCVFMHRYAWSGTSCRCKYLFCSPLLIGVRGRPWYSFWPCFWSSYLKMKDAAFHGIFSIRASLQLAHEAIGHWKRFPVLPSRRGIQILSAVWILYCFDGAGPSRVIVISRTRHISHIR